MACGRAYLAQAPLFAAPLFLEAGNAYEKAAVFSARLAQNVGASRDSQRRDHSCLAGERHHRASVALS